MTTYLRVIDGKFSYWSIEQLSHELPKKTIEQIKQEWTEVFNAANPPPEPGIMPVSFSDLVGPMPEGEGYVDNTYIPSNRYPLQGGPLDGLGLAKMIEAKKGRGKNQLTVLVPIDPDYFIVNGKKYLRNADENDNTTGYQHEDDVA